MAPLVSIPTRALPIATMDGASAGANRPLRAKASQITQARPTERIVTSAERIPEFRMTSPSYANDSTSPYPIPRDGERTKKTRGRVEMRVSQGPRKEPTGAYMFFYVRIGDHRERSETKHIGAASSLHHPPANHCHLLDLLENQFFQQQADDPDDRDAGEHDVRIQKLARAEDEPAESERNRGQHLDGHQHSPRAGQAKSESREDIG